MGITLNGILYISTSGLSAYQDALAVTSNNLANSNTTGYTREVADLVAAPSMTTTPGQFGLGVQVVNVDRLRDTLLDGTTRLALGQQAQYSELKNVGTSLENIFGDPTNPTLNADLSNFFAAYNSLTTSPADLGVRQTVTESAQTLASDFNSEANQLTTLSNNLGTSVQNAANDINAMLTQVAALNQQIAFGEASGNNPNTQLDERDNLLDKLSNYMNLTITNGVNGMINISVNGATLVNGINVNNTGVQVLNDASGHPEVYSTDPAPVALATANGGQLEGIIQSYQNIDTAQSNLDDLAATFANNVNALCLSGYDLNGNNGLPLFTYNAITPAATIAANAAVLADPSLVVAADTRASGGSAAPPVPPTPNTGSNGIAVKIAQLQNQAMAFTTMPSSTINQAVTSLVSGLGASAQSATNLYNTYTSNVNTLQNQRNSEDGVSTDEEVSNMLAYQKSYEAAAKVISAVDALMQVVINMAGATT